MANVRGAKGIEDRTRSPNLIFEKFVPSSGWTEDSDTHYLLLDLPEFKKEEVKLQVDSGGHITVNGERQVSQNKYSYFEETYRVPENSDINKTSGKFDGEILYVTVPKQVVEPKEEPKTQAENVNHVAEENLHEKPDNNENLKKDDDNDEQECHSERKEKTVSNVQCFRKESTEKREDEASVFRSAMKKLCQNKGIVITAVLAFSLGVLVSRRFQST